MDESSEKLQALKTRIESEGSPEFDTSPIIQVKDNLKRVSLLIDDPRNTARIDHELSIFDNWLGSLKTSSVSLLQTAPTDPYLSETGESEPLTYYFFRRIPGHGYKFWDTFSKQFGIALPDNLTFSQFMRQIDRNEWRQGRIPKAIDRYNRLPLTFRTNVPGVAFFTEHSVPHQEKPYALEGLGMSQTKLLFKR